MSPDWVESGQPLVAFDIMVPKDFEDVDSSSDIDMILSDDSTLHHSNGTLPSPSPSHLSSNLTHCPGIPLRWPRDHFFESYPFQRHEYSPSTIGYQFCAVEQNGQSFRVRSKHCNMYLVSDGSPCLQCQSVTKEVERLASMAAKVSAHTNHKYLTHEQLRELLKERDETILALKRESLNLGQRCASLMQRVQDCRRFLMAVATGDVPRLQQLIRQALKEGASLSKIISKLKDSLLGIYHARGYDTTDFDIALLVFHLGGRKLLYALSHYISIPSITAIKNHKTFTRIMPSPGVPTLDEVLFNMRENFLPRAKALESPFPSGMCMLWDEVAEEEQACYFGHLDAVGGMCRQHVHRISTWLTSLESAESIVRALYEGEVHYGKEASVIALASFGTQLRGAFPVVVSPTCGAETPEESARIAETVITSWNEVGAPIFGPIKSFSSDGAASRRAMMYLLFMKHMIEPQHPLYGRLSRLPGLNLYVGDGDITADFDWKHEIKRMSQLLRTQEGMVVGNTIVNRHILIQHLLRTGHHSEHEINTLMNPANAQDVPRAIDLIRAVAAIEGPNPNPGVLQEIKIIRVIGEMFSAFVDGFSKHDWCLAQQLTALSKYAHMVFILFHEYRVNLMPAQLYGDTQTTVKNVFFCVAKQQVEDGDQKLFLFWLGDDRLEALFG
ncbi:hypothetical protein JAAARDRAFT_182553 [Jaapia argillacea MUCL 33604]|uniref:Uncharacterized protein n=1 Tax=Jaapia argillacea MUCL 33604 TaxID=933084 RepID=A0A067PH95_9AGAM|nr:hypothetical protein JAAARDRAFT_182553 [Jaapia argillacea MUCL 33604]